LSLRWHLELLLFVPTPHLLGSPSWLPLRLVVCYWLFSCTSCIIAGFWNCLWLTKGIFYGVLRWIKEFLGKTPKPEKQIMVVIFEWRFCDVKREKVNTN
jgi:hypothetical protein